VEPPVTIEPQPATRPPGWRQAPLVVGPLVVLTLLSWLGTVATPALAGASPLVLMLLSPRTPVMVLAASTNPLWLFVLVGTFRLAVADPFNFMIGRLWGHQAIEWSSRRSKTARLVWRVTDRAMSRFGLLVVALHPAGSVMVLAGATGMSAWAVAAADLVGTIVYLLLLQLTAAITAAPLQLLTHTMAQHWVLASTGVAATAAFAAAIAWRSHRRERALDAELAELLDEPALVPA